MESHLWEWKIYVNMGEKGQDIRSKIPWNILLTYEEKDTKS